MWELSTVYKFALERFSYLRALGRDGHSNLTLIPVLVTGIQPRRVCAVNGSLPLTSKRARHSALATFCGASGAAVFNPSPISFSNFVDSTESMRGRTRGGGASAAGLAAAMVLGGGGR